MLVKIKYKNKDTLMCRTNIVCSMHKCVFAFKDILPNSRGPPYQSFAQKNIDRSEQIVILSIFIYDLLKLKK